MTESDLRHRIENLKDIAPPREVVLRVRELVLTGEASIDEIAELISRDVLLTTRLLRLANSARFGFPRQIESIPEAIMALGLRNVLDLALCISVVSIFDGLEGAVEAKAIWLHSGIVAEAAKRIAQRAELDTDMAFLAGLLHDVGIVVLAQCLRQEYAEIATRAGRNGQGLQATEQETLGCDHAWAAAVLFEKWELPEGLIRIVGGHHGGSDEALAAVIELASALVDENGRSAIELSVMPRRDPGPLLKQIGLQDAEHAAIREELHEEWESLESLYEEAWRGA